MLKTFLSSYGRKKAVRPRVPRVLQKSTESIELGGRAISYTQVIHPRARNLSVKMSVKNGMEVVIPPRVSVKRVPAFLEEKQAWILKHIKKLEEEKARAHTNRLRDGAPVQLCGEPYRMRVVSSLKKKATVRETRVLHFLDDRAEYGEREIVVHTREGLNGAKKELELFFRKKATAYFEHRTRELAQQMEVTYNRITMKKHTARWGSCSREKNLNFNWKLIFYPPHVIDSVIIHELAHTVHLNHGKRFYTLVEKHCPDYRKISRSMKDHVVPLM